MTTGTEAFIWVHGPPRVQGENSGLPQLGWKKITLLFCHYFTYTKLYLIFYIFWWLIFCKLDSFAALLSSMSKNSDMRRAPLAHREDSKVPKRGQAMGPWVRAERRPWEMIKRDHRAVMCRWPGLGWSGHRDEGPFWAVLNPRKTKRQHKEAWSHWLWPESWERCVNMWLEIRIHYSAIIWKEVRSSKWIRILSFT